MNFCYDKNCPNHRLDTIARTLRHHILHVVEEHGGP